MAAVDEAAVEPVEVLIERAGAAVARAAFEMLGGAYGRRVVVIAGKGNNGADGRAAAARLRRRGVRAEVLDAGRLPAELPACDLVVDAAYGTGFRGEHHPPRPPPGTPVLAVDIPSGVSGLTGVASGEPMRADRTVTFAALKPGLLLGDGPALAGEVTVADIGLDVSAARAHLVEPTDVARWLPVRPPDSHKWQTAATVVAGSPGMTGAAHLATRAAQRAGAGYVRLASPGVADDPRRPTEVVGLALPATGWAAVVLDGLDRFAALAVGPGLGIGQDTVAEVRRLVASAPGAVVVDGDGLTALGADAGAVLDGRRGPTVLTPHDGELARLGGDADAPDRIEVTRQLAARTGAVALRKGPTTVVAAPDGRVLLTTAGDARLATAGTGDVLTGVVVALLAQGMPAFEAAAAAAHLHGRAAAVLPRPGGAPTPPSSTSAAVTSGAAARGWRYGLVAGDLIDHLPAAFAELPET